MFYYVIFILFWDYFFSFQLVEGRRENKTMYDYLCYIWICAYLFTHEEKLFTLAI